MPQNGYNGAKGNGKASPPHSESASASAAGPRARRAGDDRMVESTSWQENVARDPVQAEFQRQRMEKLKKDQDLERQRVNNQATEAAAKWNRANAYFKKQGIIPAPPEWNMGWKKTE